MQGMTHDEALKLIQDVNYLGTCMVASGDADGMVSGAIHTTADTVRPALQIIKVIIELRRMCKPVIIRERTLKCPRVFLYFSQVPLVTPK